MFYDIVDEQIDVTGKAFLGLTVACARCHDHKFDPISTKDYYSLASIFASTKQLSKIEGTVSQLYFAPLVPKDIAERYEAHQKKIEDKQKEIDAVAAAEGRRAIATRWRREWRNTWSPRGRSMPKAPMPPKIASERHSTWRAGAMGEVSEAHQGAPRAPGDLVRRALRRTDETAAKRYQEDIHSSRHTAKRLRTTGRSRPSGSAKRGEQPPAAAEVHARRQPVLHRGRAAAKGPFALPEKDSGEGLLGREPRAKWRALKVELKQIKDAAPPEPPFACAVAEGEPVEQHVFLRGNPDSRGELVSEGVPDVSWPASSNPRSRRAAAGWNWRSGSPSPRIRSRRASW